MADGDTFTPQPMTPQPYPLWCAAVSEEEDSVDIGLIVGWVPPQSEYESRWRAPVPVIAAEDEYGRVVNIYAAIQHEALFFGQTREAVEDRALTWVNRPVRPFLYHVLQGKDAVGDAAVRQAVAAAERQHLRLDGRYDEVLPAELFGRSAGVMLHWERAVRVRAVHRDEQGRLVVIEDEVPVETAGSAL